MRNLKKLQKIIDEIEKLNKDTIPWVIIDGLYFDDPDEFMKYYKEHYGKGEKDEKINSTKSNKG
jgi:hypothetical protein